MTSPTVADPVAARLNRNRTHCIVCSHTPAISTPIMPAVTLVFSSGGTEASWAYCTDHVESVPAGIDLVDNSRELTLVRVVDHRTPDERLTFVEGVGTVLLPALDIVR